MSRPASVVALVLALSACAGTPISRQAADVLIPPDEEVKLGQQVKAQLLKQYKPLADPKVQAYVQGVGARIVALDKGQLPAGITPHFTVLDSPQVNAFAIPGGDIFVFSGLLKAVNNEAELASVLSHEMGHVIKRHVAQGMVTQLGLQTIASIVLGQNPSAIAKIGASLAANGYLLKYSRDNEREADQVGMATMIRSHDWDPHAMIAFFQELEKSSGGGGFAFLQNHPPPADRVQYLTRELAAAGNPGGHLYAARYQAIRALVPVRAASPPQG